MIQKQRLKREWGQGLLEFALILPVLLLVVVGTAEFGRLFAIYSNLFNAAREGTRYAMVNGDDLTGILNATLEKVNLIDPSKVSTTISYDSGPGTVAKSASDLLVGDRVIITIHYDVEPMSPLLEPLLSGMSVDTESVRTIAKVGDGVLPDPPNLPPIAAFTFSCTDLDCTFDASGSSDPDGTIDTYAWDFGDTNAEVATSATTSHSYAAGGTYTVVLTVTDDEGATDSVSQDVTVEAPNQPPMAAFTYSCTNLDCTFDASASTDADGTITDYAWDFGEGGTANGVTANYTYAAGGTYTVILTVTDDELATGSGSQDVTVAEAPNLPPNATFTYSCTDLDCTFDASGSSDPDGVISTYEWQFGDSSIGAGVMTSHSYAAGGGTFNVILTVTDNDGATGGDSKNVTVTDPPTPTATPVVEIQINKPLMAGDRTVWGSALAGMTLRLRDLQDPTVDHTVVVDGAGGFLFFLSKDLVAGHVIVVEGIDGYGAQDWAPVEGLATPTPGPTATPVPGTNDIQLAAYCGPVGDNTITVNGYGWSPNTLDIYHVFEGVETRLTGWKNPKTPANFVLDIPISNMQEGVHTIKAVSADGPIDTEDYLVPCAAPTPTPSPTPDLGPPNLVIYDMALVSVDPKTHDPLVFDVTVKNLGGPSDTPFWVELYVDPADPITAADLPLNPSTDWAAVGALGWHEMKVLSLSVPAGVSTTGLHNVFAMADTTNQVAESVEADNVGGPVAVNVTLTGTEPTPTPSPTPPPVDAGAISGSTWLLWSSSIAPQGRVHVYCEDSGMVLVAETVSDVDGNYLLEGIPPGTYDVTAEMMIGGLLYTDTIPDVEVNSGETTPFMTLYLN